MNTLERITYDEDPVLALEELIMLYKDPGWTNYTRDPVNLLNAVQKSLCVISARVDDSLAGLVRCVGDGLTIVYVQDLIVMKNFKRKGIGSNLLKLVMDKYKSVRQLVLLTDNRKELKEFYENCGLSNSADLDLLCYVRIV